MRRMKSLDTTDVKEECKELIVFIFELESMGHRHCNVGYVDLNVLVN